MSDSKAVLAALLRDKVREYLIAQGFNPSVSFREFADTTTTIYTRFTRAKEAVGIRKSDLTGKVAVLQTFPGLGVWTKESGYVEPEQAIRWLKWQFVDNPANQIVDSLLR